jgi:hypothetical protein
MEEEDLKTGRDKDHTGRLQSSDKETAGDDMDLPRTWTSWSSAAWSFVDFSDLPFWFGFGGSCGRHDSIGGNTSFVT